MGNDKCLEISLVEDLPHHVVKTELYYFPHP